MTKKVCRKCRYIIEEQDNPKNKKKSEILECPVCGNTTFTTFWKGMAVIIDPEKSEVAKAMGVSTPGKYALRLSR
ncbi:MAG TPA: transcription elongation factor subunit Spt4 [archaeon]|jgi:DNA-directed RNA polymerase subunit E"|nr:transcription elongation factor subunit Spt4 [archaeon]HPC10232.1 transcription elongation factor subunit Spt4 [archaeon]HRT02593.1 transcription elongation factor subunit Spt4 [Candidatus Diapherotrites archaeon]